MVQKTKQNTPSFLFAVMTGLADWKQTRERIIFILCGAAGPRIGEALGLEIDKHIASDFSTLTIKQKVRHCKVEEWLKTASAFRQVDLHPAIATLLKEYVGERRTGFLLCTRNGKLHPQLQTRL
jgi:integrase